MRLWSFPLLITSWMMFTSSSSLSENIAVQSLICSENPSLTPTIDPATNGSNYNRIAAFGIKKRLFDNLLIYLFNRQIWVSEFTWSSTNFTTILGTETPCFTTTWLRVLRRAWKRLSPPHASTIWYMKILSTVWNLFFTYSWWCFYTMLFFLTYYLKS